ncbi:hypothetical protein LPTSP4_28160 [Leptospira ryugenii]|uniref:HEAT repeat protein n=1 Tax=Leptospira ryugenii TaxID=1917863 RepID=A0A2P2E373_9LEPT|nr:HEAT repeat domain-containing protein [Leptospira ryugenii]GBF51284.1 hypothetical protein LPTSP4_28160 [Leptospira ryugenii]
MEVASHKTKLGQDIIWSLCLVPFFLFLIDCTSTRPFQLSDVSPKYAEFQNTDLDPNQGKLQQLYTSKNQVYDSFILKANKAISELEFGENVALQGENKKSFGEDIKLEMTAAGYLTESLPQTVEELPDLLSKCRELIKVAPNDFEGPSLGAVTNELTQIETKLKSLSQKSDRIVQSLKNLRSDSSNYTKNRDLTEAKNDKIQSTKQDPIVVDQPVVLQEEKLPEDKKDKPDNKSKIRISKLKKNGKVVGTTKELFKEEIKQVEDELSEEEKRENEYTEKIRSGLVEVFKWEYYKNGRNLEKILLTHPIPRVRSAAALALGRLKTGRLSLQKAIDKDGYQVRPSAYKALSEIGDKRSISYFFEGTRAEDIEVIAASFEGLGKTKDPSGRELLLTNGISSEYVVVVASSLRGLGYHQLNSDIPVFERFLKSAEENELRETAIDALAIHGSREALRVLETEFKEQPNFSERILESIGKNKSLSATFALIRLNESTEDPKLTGYIGELLLKRKAFGKYAFITISDDYLRLEPNERSKAISYVKEKDIAVVLKESPKEYSIRINEEIVTDKYYQLKMESSTPGTRGQYVNGWIFGSKLELIEVKSLGANKEAKYTNLNKKKKHQNIFNPIENKN